MAYKTISKETKYKKEVMSSGQGPSIVVHRSTIPETQRSNWYDRVAAFITGNIKSTCATMHANHETMRTLYKDTKRDSNNHKRKSIDIINRQRITNRSELLLSCCYYIGNIH
jgi:hypothetical protein